MRPPGLWPVRSRRLEGVSPHRAIPLSSRRSERSFMLRAHIKSIFIPYCYTSTLQLESRSSSFFLSHRFCRTTYALTTSQSTSGSFNSTQGNRRISQAPR
ncbi:hypothetical protein BO71DRAFT_252133 [Aspergillus ellipticus CBS 707.79]|uniref:Uncharacterized protein n=1 Tax=Aspergillus ellipticus CBS 707.79 TaxID=1448320 RepID=A0A319D8Q0_9EURO|nr:hypothetical protein BO71DRAFT_252133 [Aspergillus ellipticus CBS 707.79]